MHRLAETKKTYSKLKNTRKMGPVCACHLKCYETVDRNTRMSIFKKYNGKDMTRTLKNQFILSRVVELPVGKRHVKTSTRRQVTLNYTFLVNKKVVRVCKKFFMNTLGITTIRAALLKGKKGMVQDEKREKQPVTKVVKKIKTQIDIPYLGRRPEDMKDTIRKHIEMLCDCTDDCGENEIQQKFREFNLTFGECYSSYLKYCAKENVPEENVAPQTMYRRVAHLEYNIKAGHRSDKYKMINCENAMKQTLTN